MATDSDYKLGEGESKIPAFTVLKNGAILKNIFIVNNNSDHDRLEPEQILIVGRHPDCNVMLTHPSISRFHLQIQSNPSLQKLSVIDLSSVHGTWVSEKKIDPWARVELHEGDSLRIGGSSRVYRLHWIPLRQAYDFETPYASASDSPLTKENGEEVSMQAYQDENSLPIENEPVEEEENIVTWEKKAQEEESDGNNSFFMENKEIQSLDLVVEGMSSLFSEETLGITVEKEIPSAPPMPQNPVYSLFDDDDECIQSSLEDVDGPSFGTESGKLSLPFEGVILDSELAEAGRDSQSLEPSMVSRFVGERECPELDISIANEEKSAFAAAPAVVLEETANQSFFIDDFGQTDKSLLQVGAVVGETENQHDIKELDLEAPYAIESPSHKGKQETDNQSLFIEDVGQTDKSLLQVGEVDGKTENQNNDVTDPSQEHLYALESPPSHKVKQENSKSCYDEVPPATEILKETEEQKLCLEDHEEKDVSTEYCTPCMKGSVSSNFPAEEVVLEISDDKENWTQQSFYTAAVLPQSEKIRNSPIRPENTPGFGSIWSRRGKPASVIQLQTGGRRGEVMVDAVYSECEQNNQENMEDILISKGIFSSLDKEEAENFNPNKENFTPNTILVKSLKKDKLASVSKFRNGKTRVESMMASADSVTEQQKDIFSCLDGGEEEIFTPDKENFTPDTLLMKSLKKKGKLGSVSQLQSSKCRAESMQAGADSEGEQHNQEATESKSISREIFSCLDCEEEDIFTPEKENVTPKTLLGRSSKKEGKRASVNQLKTSKSRVERMLFGADCEDEQKNQEAPKEKSISKEIFSCLNVDDEEIFTPDKEITLLQKSLKKKKGKLEEVKHSKQCGSSSPRLTLSPNMHTEKDLIASSNKDNWTLRVLKELKPLRQPVSRNQVKLEQESMFNKRRPGRVPFQSLVVNTVGKTRSDKLGLSSDSKSNSSANYSQNAEKKFTNPLSSNSIREAKRSWTMVVDTTTLLNKESRKSLQLLEGLRGTRLIIPRMVIRELDCLKRRGSLFRRKTKACLVLEWIEQCMVEKSWWIQVQSSAEDGRLTAPTPPASPRSPFSQGSGGFGYGTTSSLPFLSQGGLMEIVSPTTEDHILECSLLCRKMMSDRHLVLLSDDITLKIKAMAEGLICETVREFRESLMNPFSERFLWIDSSPRGQTWSASDDVVLREKYNRFPLRKSLKGESAKGLKLILLHNSHYGQRIIN